MENGNQKIEEFLHTKGAVRRAFINLGHYFCDRLTVKIS
jgi:hypothetical protein